MTKNTDKTLQPIMVVIGYKDLNVVNSAWLTSTGVKTEDGYYLLGKNLGRFDSAIEANKCFQESAQEFEYVEIKTLYTLK